MAMSSTISAVCGSSSLIQVPRLAVLRELEHRRDAGKRLLPRSHARDALPLPNAVGQFLAVMVAQLRLVIEQIDVRRARPT